MKNITRSPNAASGFARGISSVALLAIFLIAASNPALACGCCSAEAQRDETTNKISGSEKEILQAIKFSPIAELFGITEDAVGLVNFSADNYEEISQYAIASAVTPDLLTFRLSHAGKGRGTISFSIPEHISMFRVDIRDGKISKGWLGPALYKEWRLNGDATLTGLVLKGTHKAKVQLVLQGRGISCPAADDFSHWSLAIDGKQVQFRLTGELIK